MVDAKPSPALRETVRRLAELTGEADVDSDDGHARWSVYRRAAESSDARKLLFQAVSNEGDVSLASAVVTLMLERVDAAERGQWVNALDPIVRPFAEERSAELGILDGLRTDRIGAREVAAGLADYSDWLQRPVCTGRRRALPTDYAS
jgi:hypothetical protein